VLALVLPVLLMSRDEFAGAEFHLLLLSSLYGVCLLLSSDSFLTLFIGLELMSLPVYALVLLAFRRPESAEAALKYLVLSGAASATFLLGVSFLYGAGGSLGLAAFAGALASDDLMATAAVVLVIVAFFLKAAVVPFGVRTVMSATGTANQANARALPSADQSSDSTSSEVLPAAAAAIARAGSARARTAARPRAPQPSHRFR